MPRCSRLLRLFEYLATDASIAPDVELQREHVAALLNSAVGDIRAAFDRAMNREFRKEGQSIDGAAVLTATARRLISILEAVEGTGCFGDVSDVDLLKQYSDVADDAIEQCFDRIALDIEHRRLLRQACGLTLHRDSYSDLSTGFVFAGFGTDELSPSLVAYQIDGIVSGRLKCRMTEKVVTHRKRKFSSAAESVGGPIDVALISRNDGFVWVRRKHYFDSGLNPRYFHRKFGARYA